MNRRWVLNKLEDVDEDLGGVALSGALSDNAVMAVHRIRTLVQDLIGELSDDVSS